MKTDVMKRLALPILVVSVITISIFLCYYFLIGNTKNLERLPPPNISTGIAVSVDGHKDIRYNYLRKDDADAFNKALASSLNKRKDINNIDQLNFLALSGGGDKGAFGSGLLIGWSQQGSRPEFDVVTGVSTGALLSPFAYLGTSYNNIVKEIYTTISSEDLMSEHRITGLLFKNSIADNKPLYQLISKYITLETLQKISYEYTVKNRSLFILTSNIDNSAPIIWNMGKIASANNLKSLELFKTVMLTSAAIPGLFPPKLFEISENGSKFHEMHVDGGIFTQIFLFPISNERTEFHAALSRFKIKRAYLVRNSFLEPETKLIKNEIMSIAARSMEQILGSQAKGDLLRIYNFTQKEKIEFNLAYIAEDFIEKHDRDFDKIYMNKLYDYSYKLASKEFPWIKEPPGFSKAFNVDIEKRIKNDDFLLSK